MEATTTALDTMAKVEPETQLVAVGPATGSGGADGIARVAVAAKNALHEAHSDDGKGAAGDKKAKEPAAKTASFFQLFMFADRIDYLLMAIGTLGAVGNGMAFPAFAIVFADFTDVFGSEAGSSTFMDSVAKIALYFVYIAIGAAGASFLQSSMWLWTSNRQTTKLRKVYLNSVLRQDVAFFDTQTTTGSLLQLLNEETDLVQQAIGDKLAHFIQHTSCFFIGYIVAFVRGWDMTLVMLGTIPFIAGVSAILNSMTTYTSTKQQESYSDANSAASQTISQIRTVVAYSREETAINDYHTSLEKSIKIGYLQNMIMGVCTGAIQAIVNWTYAVAFIYGAWRVSTGNYTGGDVLNVLVAALIGGFSAGQAAPVITNFSKGVSAITRILTIVNRVPQIDVDNHEGLTPESCLGEIELRSVMFKYPARPDVNVFTNFNLVIPAGKTVALVGSSGSGKSTAAQLIERFYDPDAGAVLLDGVDLRQLQLKWLRTQIGLVSQEPTLFATTILENIAMGRKGATREEVIKAAEAANAHKFISHLPLAYDTHVGERGLSLSGGQKQRIAIARAILKNPRILLLDEATSALDTESERIVQDALDQLVVGRTTLIIAHRLSTIQNADIIAVVSKGEVVEQGTHMDLITKETGIYTTLVKLQMKEEMEKQAKHLDGEGAEVHDIPEDPDEILELASPNGAHLAAPGSKTASFDVEGGHLAPVDSVPLSTGAKKSGFFGRGSGEVKRTSQEMRRGSAPGEVDVEAGEDDIKGNEIVSTGCCGLSKKTRKQVEEEERKKAAEVDVPLSRLVAINKPEWPYAVYGTVGAAAVGVVQPAFAFIISSMIIILYDTDVSQIMHKASFLCWMFFVVGCGVLIGSIVMFWGFGVIGVRLALRVRLMLFRSMVYQEVGWFDMPEHSSSTLATRLSTDAMYVRGAVGDTLALMIQNLVCLAFGFIVAFVYNWRMALVVLGTLPLMISGSIIHYKNMAGQAEAGAKLYAGANQAVSDAFSSIRVIHSYSLKQEVTHMYSEKVNGAKKEVVKQSCFIGATQGYSQFAMFSVYGLIIWFGGLDVDQGRSTFDQMLKAFLSILLAAMGLAQSAVGFPDVGKAKGAIQNVFPIIDRESKIDASKVVGAQPSPGEFKGEVELHHVKFVYPARPSVVVFRDFSLRIPSGKTVALVGESGSGKSTIVGLIERFYDVVQGSVTIDGRDIKEYNLRWLREQISVVSQEPLLFSCSILDNIKYGRPNATMEEVEAAAEAANAIDFIRALPDGFNTLVGERGMQLSGGQKQRVAIARAVIKQPRIILLDEATSALDAAAERVVQEALDKIMVGRTSVVVAHRLSTIRNADKIALVFRGSILEEGTHDELMAIPDGGYSRLVAAQTGNNATMRRSMASKARIQDMAAAAKVDTEDD